jgi:esterase FrsA
MRRMRGIFKTLIIVATLVGAICWQASTSRAQQMRPERTIEEIKVEAISRAENGQYPCIGLNPDDLREAFEHIKTRDRDEWAAAFITVGDKWMAEGKSLEATDPAKANADYIRAWKVYSFGRWPVPNSPGKQRAYEKAIEAFRAHAKFWDPSMEIVHIPFEGKEITGYVRLPKNATGPVPFIIAVNGLDSR